ncbi:MAG: TRAP transporter large permease subunit [Oscillospiraceae bacterium]|nr:TRAP transporter large permease subunit [Oscillospiraceae bacterium]MBQ7055212.1 TRAP transporter large permease subunit [Oscillospiraceae bacterium]
MVPALIVFGITYVLLFTFQKLRPYIAIGSAVVFSVMCRFTLPDIWGAIDWNVLMMIAGTMGTVYLFIESKMPDLLADIIIDKVPNVKWAVVWLSLFAGIISAFVDNVATVLMIAPVALDIAKKLKINPVAMIISIAVSSNLQGAATLVGDTTSILLGGALDMTFLDFFWYKGAPGLFWVVQTGAVASAFILMWLFRKEKQPIESHNRTEVRDYFPTVLLVGTIVLLIVASFIPEKPAETNGYICMALMVIGVLRELIFKKNKTVIRDVFKEIDFFTLGLLAGLFVVIAGIEDKGVIDAISQLFLKLGNNKFVIYSVIVWASVLLSAFIDNIPYVATMLPVVMSLSSQLGMEPTLLAFGLLVGATLGGNLSPIGASANITGIGILRGEGHEVKTRDFMRIGVPFTLVAVLSGYILVWLFW